MQQHYFVSAPATPPIDLLEGMGIVAITEHERKRRVLRRESQRAPTCVQPNRLRTKIKEFMEERRSTLVLEVLFGQQLIANALVCCAEAQHLAYDDLKAG